METFTASDLNFSNSAIAHFNKVLKDRGRGEGVRLGIKKAGCSGYEYTFNFVDEVLDNYPKSLILKQVEMGVYLRMACLHYLLK